MCPDIINRYLSNVMTVDQIEALRNKTVDGAFNTFANIPTEAIGKIEDKTKLHDHIVYKDVPNQTMSQHVDVNIQGLQDGDKLEWNETTSRWVNVQITEGGGEGDVNGGVNIGEDGASVFYQENASHLLEFSKLQSLDTALSIVNNGDVVEFDLVDASTIAKGIIQLNTSGEATATKAVMGTDSRLSNTRTPTSHATSHKSAQADVIKLDELGAPDDNTTLDASITKHGLMKKFPNNTTTYLRADGTFATPATSSGVIALDKEVSQILISSDATERTVFSHVVGGGTLGTNGVLRITVGGTYLNNTSAGEELGVAIKIGSTVLWRDDLGSITEQANTRAFYLTAMISMNNSATSQKLIGFVSISDDHAPTTGLGGQDDDEGEYSTPIRGTSSINWATDQTVSVIVQLSASSSSHTFTRDLAIMEQL